MHQAVWNIVGSIVLALGLIIWFFRKDMNFTKTGHRIKQLVYAWMIQNLVVVLHTIYRNSVYIGQYQLSYLRIGVFVFLLLCVIGLVISAIKIRNQKSTWFLATKCVCLVHGLDSIICSKLGQTHHPLQHSTHFGSAKVRRVLSQHLVGCQLTRFGATAV